jgi:hypothetical protein
MRYSHQVIIHYVSKVICREPVVLNYHLVVYNVVFEYYFAVHQVFELCFALRDLHSDDV